MERDLAGRRAKTWFFRAAIAGIALGAAYACAPPADDEVAGSAASAIEGGRTINDPLNPISSQFPVSTVMVRTPKDGASAGLWESCTGVIVAPTKILTAAHCVYKGPASSNPAGAPQIFFYPVGAGKGAVSSWHPDAKNAAAAVQPGLASCSDDPHCYVSGSHHADLAILTLAFPIDAPYKPAVLGPREGSFANTALWAVGTGQMNWLKNKGDADVNPDGAMQWVPMYSVKAGPATGTIATGSLLADYGDSGGPIYAYDWTKQQLTLYGILSYIHKEEDAGPGASGLGVYWDVYTSVVQGDNYDWLRGQITSTTASFGAAL